MYDAMPGMRVDAVTPTDHICSRCFGNWLAVKEKTQKACRSENKSTKATELAVGQ